MGNKIIEEIAGQLDNFLIKIGIRKNVNSEVAMVYGTDILSRNINRWISENPEQIKKLVEKHRIYDAQRLYFEDINNKREELIRL